MYFLTFLLTAVAVGTELSQQGPFPLSTAVQAASERSYPHTYHSTGIIPPSALWLELSLCSAPYLPPRWRGGWKPKLIIPLGNPPAARAPAGQVGEELLMAEVFIIFVWFQQGWTPTPVSLHTIRSNSSGTFPCSLQMKFLHLPTCSALPGAAASSFARRPGGLLLLFLLLSNGGFAHFCHLTSLHFQSLQVRVTGVGLWHLPHLSFIPSPTSEGPQLCLMGPMWALPMDVTAARARKQEYACPWEGQGAGRSLNLSHSSILFSGAWPW